MIVLVENFKSMHFPPFFFVSFSLILVCIGFFFCQVLLISFSFRLNELKHITSGMSYPGMDLRLDDRYCLE